DGIRDFHVTGVQTCALPILTAHHGLDKTIFQQFWIWLDGVFRGDFGTSISLRQPVMPLVLGRLPATLELAIFALVIAVAIGGVQIGRASCRERVEVAEGR